MKQNEDHDDRKDQNDRNTSIIAFPKQKGKRVSRAWLFLLLACAKKQFLSCALLFYFADQLSLESPVSIHRIP